MSKFTLLLLLVTILFIVVGAFVAAFVLGVLTLFSSFVDYHNIN